ncbi:MAG: type III secretion system export apparatus subunit SctT [Plesiomonas sp.]
MLNSIFSNSILNITPNSINVITLWLTSLFIGFLRPLGVFLLLPIFTSKSLNSSLFRNVLIIGIALPMIPIIHDIKIFNFETNLWATTIQEVLIGFFIGFFFTIPFWAIDMAGYLIDTLRGASMATLLNPTLNAQSSIFGMFLTQLFSFIFLFNGGLHSLIKLIYRSYSIAPPGSFHQLYGNSFLLVYNTWSAMYQICLRLSLPAILIMVIIDISFGLINRAAQQLNVFFISMPIKSILATLMIIITLSFSVKSYTTNYSLIQRKLFILLTNKISNGEL